MNKEFLGVVAAVIHPDFPKGDIADDNIEVVIGQVGLFKALYCDTRSLVELLRNPARQRVKLHTIQPACPHAFRKQTKKVARSAGRLKDCSFGVSQTVKGFIHAFDDHRRGIKSCQGRLHSGTVFRIGQFCFQFLILRRPCRIMPVKRHRKPAPSHIL